jgi:hypothetical protein
MKSVHRVGNIKGLIDLISEDKPTDPQVIQLLTNSVNALNGIIEKINLNQ